MIKKFKEYNCQKLSDTTSYYIIENWLKNGCDPNYIQDPSLKESLIMINAEHGSLDTVKMLINYGGDVNAQNSYGNTVLHRFYDTNENVRESLVDLIINSDINWQIKNTNGDTFLDIMKRYFDGDYSGFEYCGIYEYVINSYPDKYEKYLKHKKSNKFNL
jgi:ankyrin repeat protein